MTTIAWDGKTLAADRRVTTEYGQISTICKIFKTDDFIFAGAGELSDMLELSDWLLHDGKKPTFRADGTHGMFISLADGKVNLVVGKKPRIIEMIDNTCALGTGAGYAVGAMATGANAEKAVKIASLFDCFTGDQVDTVTVLP